MTSLQRPTEERESWSEGGGEREKEGEGGKTGTDHWTVGKKIAKNANGGKKKQCKEEE